MSDKDAEIEYLKKINLVAWRLLGRIKFGLGAFFQAWWAKGLETGESRGSGSTIARSIIITVRGRFSKIALSIEVAELLESWGAVCLIEWAGAT